MAPGVKKAKRAVAVVMLAASCIGTVLAAVGIIGGHEPRLTHTLSWLALAYAGFVAVEVS